MIKSFYDNNLEKPERLGIVANLYKQYTASALTDALMNVYHVSKDKSNRFTPANSFMIEWEISTNFVKRLPILAMEGDGSNGTEIIFQFPEHYYERHDVFVIEETRQQCFVLTRPYRRSDNCFEYVCRVVSTDYETIPTTVVGTDTRFVTNHQPELHKSLCTFYVNKLIKFS